MSDATYRTAEVRQTAEHEREARASDRERFGEPDPKWDLRTMLDRMRLALRVSKGMGESTISLAAMVEAEKSLTEFAEFHFGMKG